MIRLTDLSKTLKFLCLFSFKGRNLHIIWGQTQGIFCSKVKSPECFNTQKRETEREDEAPVITYFDTARMGKIIFRLRQL